MLFADYLKPSSVSEIMKLYMLITVCDIEHQCDGIPKATLDPRIIKFTNLKWLV